MDNAREFDVKEATDHILNPSCRFGELEPGELFRFPGSQSLMVKTKSGYRRQSGSPVFKMGAKVAVIQMGVQHVA